MLDYEYKVPENEIKGLVDIMILCCHDFAYGRRDGVTTIRTGANPSEFRKLRDRALCMTQNLESDIPYVTQAELRDRRFMACADKYFGHLEHDILYAIEGYEVLDPC